MGDLVSPRGRHPFESGSPRSGFNVGCMGTSPHSPARGESCFVGRFKSFNKKTVMKTPCSLLRCRTALLVSCLAWVTVRAMAANSGLLFDGANDYVTFG